MSRVVGSCVSETFVIWMASLSEGSVAWAAAGLALPRDARQQVIMGRMVAARWYMPPLQPGDLLFFFDHNTGKIYHVGISIGGKRYLHYSPPEVTVSSYDPADPL